MLSYIPILAVATTSTDSLVLEQPMHTTPIARNMLLSKSPKPAKSWGGGRNGIPSVNRYGIKIKIQTTLRL